METPKNTKILYCWNSVYPNEFMGEVEVPENMDPAECQTSEIPPEHREGFAICRDCLRNTWVYQPDHRGKVYWTPDMTWKDSGIPVSLPGPIPEEYTFTAPEKPMCVLRDEISKQITDKRVQMMNQGLTIDDVCYDTDRAAQIRYLGFIEAHKHDSDYRVDWLTTQGTWVPMTVDKCRKIHREIQRYIEQCFQWEYKKQEELRNTPNEKLQQFRV